MDLKIMFMGVTSFQGHGSEAMSKVTDAAAAVSKDVATGIPYFNTYYCGAQVAAAATNSSTA